MLTRYENSSRLVPDIVYIHSVGRGAVVIPFDPVARTHTHTHAEFHYWSPYPSPALQSPHIADLISSVCLRQFCLY